MAVAQLVHLFESLDTQRSQSKSDHHISRRRRSSSRLRRSLSSILRISHEPTRTSYDTHSVNTTPASSLRSSPSSPFRTRSHSHHLPQIHSASADLALLFNSPLTSPTTLSPSSSTKTSITRSTSCYYSPSPTRHRSYRIPNRTTSLTRARLRRQPSMIDLALEAERSAVESIGLDLLEPRPRPPRLSSPISMASLRSNSGNSDKMDLGQEILGQSATLPAPPVVLDGIFEVMESARDC